MAGQLEDDWLELVLRASGQDEATAPADDLQAEADRLCQAGVDGACSFAAWGVAFHPANARLALDPECKAGDPVSCLVAAWTLGQSPWGTWWQQAPAAVDARLFAERACELGSKRGCVEVARALFAGVGSTGRPNKARERLDALCRAPAREASACGFQGRMTADPKRKRDLFARAADLGFVPALRWIALYTDSDRLLFHEAACTAGIGASCRDVAAMDLARLRPSLEAGCTVRHVPACTDLAVLHFRDGDEEGALAALDAMCPTYLEACSRAQLLRHGTPARPTLPGTLTPDDRIELEISVRDGAWGCYLRRLAKNDTFGTVTIDVQVSSDGGVEGASVVGDLVDDPFERCIHDEVRNVDLNSPPGDGPALVKFEEFLAHGAVVEFQSRTFEDSSSPDGRSLTDELATLAPAIEACALLDPVEVAPIAVDVTIRRNGRIVVHGVRRSSESAAVDVCVTQVLGSARLVSWDDHHRGLVLVDFLQALGNAVPEDG
jgi:hypothetical protein